jgi:hypothetical protein
MRVALQRFADLSSTGQSRLEVPFILQPARFGEYLPASLSPTALEVRGIECNRHHKPSVLRAHMEARH